MVVCICLRSIKIFTLKIKLFFFNKICHFLKKKMLCKVPIFFIHRLGVADRDEKSGGCHLKKLVMTSLPKNQ
jgi:hypothetical protein